jgi:hypothetical protein
MNIQSNKYLKKNCGVLARPPQVDYETDSLIQETLKAAVKIGINLIIALEKQLLNLIGNLV